MAGYAYVVLGYEGLCSMFRGSGQKYEFRVPWYLTPSVQKGLPGNTWEDPACPTPRGSQAPAEGFFNADSRASIRHAGARGAAVLKTLNHDAG